MLIDERHRLIINEALCGNLQQFNTSVLLLGGSKLYIYQALTRIFTSPWPGSGMVFLVTRSLLIPPKPAKTTARISLGSLGEDPCTWSSASTTTTPLFSSMCWFSPSVISAASAGEAMMSPSQRSHRLCSHRRGWRGWSLAAATAAAQRRTLLLVALPDEGTSHRSFFVSTTLNIDWLNL